MGVAVGTAVAVGAGVAVGTMVTVGMGSVVGLTAGSSTISMTSERPLLARRPYTST